jgi:hypothetical protein
VDDDLIVTATGDDAVTPVEVDLGGTGDRAGTDDGVLGPEIAVGVEYRLTTPVLVHGDGQRVDGRGGDRWCEPCHHEADPHDQA